jgi:tetratricopeptide (TPR) repeat protein
VRYFYYDLLSKSERQAMHRRAGAYYETEEPDELKAARHFVQAEEHAKAAQLVTDKVWALVNQGKARPLRLLLEQFQAQQLEAQQWVRINLARGQFYTLQGESPLARQSYQAALSALAALPGSTTLQELRTRACEGMGDLLRYESPQEALHWLLQGLSELAGANTREEAALRIKVGLVQVSTGDLAAALRSLEQGLTLLDESPGSLRATALLNIGNVYAYRGDLKKSSEYSLLALEISEQLHDYFQIVGILNNLGIDQDIAGKWDDAIAKYEKALALAKQLGDVRRQTGLELALGNIYIKRADDEAAGTHLSNCLALARAHHLRKHLVWADSSLADLHLRQGKWEEAKPLLIEAEQVALALEAKAQFPEIYRRCAEAQLSERQPVAALEYAERSTNLARELGLAPEEGMSLRVLGQALLANHRQEQALGAFERSLSILADHDPYEAARTKMQWGINLAKALEPLQGLSLLQEARATFQQLGARRELAEVDGLLR